jgi:uncharacterized protein (DUF433 family)
MEPTDSFDRIESDPAVMMGKPVVAGTRITVESILERLAAGETVEDVLAAHPQLERADVEAAFSYAVSVLRMDVAGSVSKSAD